MADRGCWQQIRVGLWPVWQRFGGRLRTKLRYAYYKGDIWQVPPGLWLIENELGGWTVMRPEDY